MFVTVNFCADLLGDGLRLFVFVFFVILVLDAIDGPKTDLYFCPGRFVNTERDMALLFLNRGHNPMEPTGGNHSIVLLEVVNHLLEPLFLALLGDNKQEVGQSRDQDKRRKLKPWICLLT